ncbi:hypothetical protein IOD13_10370 [Brevibacterium casei]|nr:hypothetical protein [Brevibacterium casei]
MREEHEAQVATRTDAHVARRMAGEKHPVEDFLFTYYPFKAGQLAKWNPGAGVLLELETSGDREYVDRRWYRTDGTVAEVDLESWRADRGEGLGSSPRFCPPPSIAKRTSGASASTNGRWSIG